MIDIPINKLTPTEDGYTAKISELWDAPMYHYPLELSIIPEDTNVPIIMVRPTQKREDGKLIHTDYDGRWTETKLRIFHDAEFDDLAARDQPEVTPENYNGAEVFLR